MKVPTEEEIEELIKNKKEIGRLEASQGLGSVMLILIGAFAFAPITIFTYSAGIRATETMNIFGWIWLLWNYLIPTALALIFVCSGIIGIYKALKGEKK